MPIKGGVAGETRERGAVCFDRDSTREKKALRMCR